MWTIWKHAKGILKIKAIENLIKNPKSFYSHIKKLTNRKTKIGPFVNEKGEIIEDIPADILQAQYSEQWSYPSENYEIKDSKKFFEYPEAIDRPKLCNVISTKKKLLKVIKKLKANGSPGPDGVTPLLLKMFCDELAVPLLKIFEESFENGIFPDIWKIAYICPLKKTWEIEE